MPSSKMVNPTPPANLQELTVADEVLPALKKMADLGYLLLGATNQPDVARGTTSKATVEAINKYLLERLPVQEMLVCYHDDNDHCDCRKPAPGLLVTAAKKYAIDLAGSIMIGDRWKDIAAGQAAGCKTIWLNRNYQERTPTYSDFMTTSLEEAANWVQSITLNCDGE